MRKRLNFRSLSLFLILPAFVQAESFDYRAYTDQHMDIGPKLENGVLSGYWKNDFAVIEGVIDLTAEFEAHELRAVGIFDSDTPPYIRNSGSQWNFLGVGAGEPFYAFPSGGIPDTLPYLGFSTEHPSVGAYEDFRITLTAMTGPQGGVFSLYTGASNVFMNTLNGISPEEDYIDLQVGDHAHYNWAFSLPGTYDLTFLFEVFDAMGTLSHSGSDTFRFHITTGGGYDNYEHWRRTHFHPDDFEDDAISGSEADAGLAVGLPKHFTNAQRFAFGNNPTVEFTEVEIDSVLYPAVRLTLRKDTGGLNTFPEVATDLLGSWSDDLTEVESERKRIRHDPGLERRLYRLNTPPADGPLFFRAGAEIVSEISAD
ncbi:MAG: choice-of-anchor M domain-containing protein [Verrucomicrobia bacterium]|nr:choice-of-anchor M domain-containing protein [Verrucomicrobiota bacterium]MCH8528351.1 choice-of-anchor M domain-containing protein [Kiritimatiellia bacterium]